MIKIGENIRKYRRERELSQETLAERLNVSFQTVSKWERGETHPDITMLPSLASFFNVSVDTLLGVQEINEAESVKSILESIRELEMHYEYDKIREKIDEALKLYPNNYDLLAYCVYVNSRYNPKKSIEIGKYVLDNCTDQRLRGWVHRSMCYAYYDNGDKDFAIKLAEELPCYYDTMEDVLRMLLTGDKQKEHIQDNIIIKLAYEFWFSIRKIRNQYAPNEQIELYKKSNAIYDAIYETDDVPFVFVRKMRNYQGMAEVCLENDMVDEAYEYMNKATECAILHDKLPNVVTSKALLFNCHEYDRKIEYKPYLQLTKELLHDFETEDEYYASLRNTEEYKKVIEKLQ